MYPVPSFGGWTNMIMQSGWIAGTGGQTPQYNYNAATKTVGIRGKITTTTVTSTTGSIVIANNLPTTSQIQYLAGCMVNSGSPISTNVSGSLLALVITAFLSSGDGVFLGGTYMAL